MSLVSSYEKGFYNQVVGELKSWSKKFLANSPLEQRTLKKPSTGSPQVSQDAQEVFPLEENRLKNGRRPFASREEFSSARQYLAAMWLGAKIAQETEEKDQKSTFDTSLHIVRFEDGRLMCFFYIPDDIKEAMRKNPKTRLEEGDHMMACFEHDKEKRDREKRERRERKARLKEGNHTTTCFDRDQEKNTKVYYDLRIIEPLPFSKPGSVTAAMTRRLRTTVVEETELPDPPFTSLESLGKMSNVQTMNCIMAGEGAEVEIETVWRHSEFVYVFRAAQMLAGDDPGPDRRVPLHDVHQVMLNDAVAKDQVPRLDIYETLVNKHLASPDRLCLNESQKEALQMSRNTPAGFMVAHGGPGTGKTHFVTELLKPFFLDERHHRILLTAAGNRGADNMARILNNVLEDISPARNGVYVVRMHSVKTETRIFLSEAKATRRKHIAAKKGLKLPADRQTGNANDAISSHFRAHAMGKYEATDDDRLQEIDLSVGTHMRKNLSQAPDELQELYVKYADGHDLDALEHARLWELALGFLRLTILGSTAVCCTVAGAFDIDVHTSFKGAEMIVVDEAARVTEYQLWPLIAFYPQARGKIMVGDPYQLGPSGPRNEDRNPFQYQLELSLQYRLQLREFPTAFFTVQYRVVPELAAIFNKTCYDSRLNSAVTASVESRPLAQAIRQHNKLHYNVNHSVVFFDVKGAKEALYKGRPKYCDEYITTVSEIVEDLLMAGFGRRKHPCSIVILTTYKLEAKRLKQTWIKMLQSEMFDENATVAVETVDRAQGMEYDIAIVDPVAVKSAGFLTNNRLNVLFSRARNGLYVVGDMSQWQRMFQKECWRDTSRGAAALERFATELWRDNSYVVSWPQKEWLGGRRVRYYDPEDFLRGQENDTER